MSIIPKLKGNDIEFDTPANRIIQQLQPKNQFRIDTSLPDISFLRQLSVQGRLRYFTGQVTPSGGIILTITPNLGETIFIYRIAMTQTASASRITLVNDGNIRVDFIINVTLNPIFTFDILDSLVGDGIKTITLEGTAGATIGTVLGWSENTSRIRDVTT